MSSEAIDLIERILATNNYSMKINPTVNNELFIQIYDNKNNNLVGEIQGSVSDENIVMGTTRASVVEEVPTIHIIHLSTESSYRNRGFAFLLFFYFMEIMRLQNPTIQFAKLDNMSDNAGFIKGDIYSKFGFTSQELVKAADSFKTYTGLYSGLPPEMQLKMDYYVKNINKNIKYVNDNIQLEREKGGKKKTRKNRKKTKKNKRKKNRKNTKKNKINRKN